MAQSVRLALIQLLSTHSKSCNLGKARKSIIEAAQAGANILILPECFNSPYGTKHFAHYAEPIPDLANPGLSGREDAEQCPTTHMLSEAAALTRTVIVGGSIPERDPHNGALYNTCVTYGPDGKQLGRPHRKTHLFDISIPNKITFKESETLTAGNNAVSMIDLPAPLNFTIAVGICYDVRFPEPAMIAARRGATLLIYPGAFNMTTGPLHWELLARARALDNQVFVAMCSPARNLLPQPDEYVAYGHSLVVDPSGAVVSRAGYNEEILYSDIYLSGIQEIRDSIPVTRQRRFDLYPDISSTHT